MAPPSTDRRVGRCARTENIESEPPEMTRRPQRHTVSVHLTEDEVARLDEIRSGEVSRSAFMRGLLRNAGPQDAAPSHDEAVGLLAESARGGKVAAQIALERALRSDQGATDPDGELARLLRGD